MSSFANLNNLQFLCENGRVHKFANSICSPAFLLQDYKQQSKGFSVQHDFVMPFLDFISEAEVETPVTEPLVELSDNASFSRYWNNYAVKLSTVLCSFLLSHGEIRTDYVQVSEGRLATSVSSTYWELSTKWILKVLRTWFPCIKACSNQNEMPSHLR